MKKLLGLIISIFLLLQQTAPVIAQSDLTSATENFINVNMRNSNGTLASYLQDQSSTNPGIAAGRESLSESMGLQLLYLFNKNDRKEFNANYEILNKYYVSQTTGLVLWKLNADGTTSITTNALLDDWRIAVALFKAGEAWKDERYIKKASDICKALNNYNRSNGYLVDFYDQKYKINNDTLSLFYIEPTALQYMVKYNLIDKKTFQRVTNLLKTSSNNDGLFFAQNYNVKTNTFTYASELNMVEQIYTAYFRKQLGVNSPAFYSFVKNEFNKNGLLYGRYIRESRQPAVKYESNAVYGMLIMYAMEMKDPAFAKRVYQRMKKFEVSDPQSPYYGGYVVKSGNGYNTHVFDNLFPLLAKQKLEILY